MSHPRVRSNITSWTPCGHEGTGNVLRENCIWPATFEGHGFTLLNNLTWQPAYVNAAAKDFRIVQGTPCAPLLDNPDVPGTEALPVPGMWGTGIGARQFHDAGERQGQGPPRAGDHPRARRRAVRLGGRLVLTGRVREGVAVPDTARALIEVRGAKRWLYVRRARIGANRRFRVSLRLKQRSRPHARLLAWRRTAVAVAQEASPAGARAGCWPFGDPAGAGAALGDARPMRSAQSSVPQ